MADTRGNQAVSEDHKGADHQDEGAWFSWLNSLLAWPSISQRERNVLIQAHEEPGTTRDCEVFLFEEMIWVGIGCESEEVGSDMVPLRFLGANRS